MSWIAYTIGATLPAYLMLRLMLSVLRRLRPIGARFAVAVPAAIAAHTALSAFGGENNGEWPWSESFASALVAGVVVAAVEAARRAIQSRRQSRATIASASLP